MTKLKAFFYIFNKSISSIDYYKEMLKTKTSFTVKYFLMMSLLMSLILTVSISATQIPIAQKAVGDFANYAREMFPVDLVITIKSNAWSLNKTEPFIVPLPRDEKPSDNDLPRNFLVLSQKGTIEDLDMFDTIILVNAKNVLVRDSKGFRAYPLENLPDGTITRADFEGFTNQMLGLAKNLPYLLVIFIFLGTLLYFALFQGTNVLTFALLVWLASAVFKKGLSYTESARITAHTMTLPLTILVLTKLVGYSVPMIFWFEITNIVFALVVLSKLGPKGEIDDNAASIEAQ